MEKNLLFPNRGADLNSASRSIFIFKSKLLMLLSFILRWRIVRKKSTRKPFNYYVEFLVGKLWIRHRITNSKKYILPAILQYGILFFLYAFILIYDQGSYWLLRTKNGIARKG